MTVPKPLTTDSPVKLIFVGGFLGSGKTTALAVLARDLIRQGKRNCFHMVMEPVFGENWRWKKKSRHEFKNHTLGSTA